MRFIPIVIQKLVLGLSESSRGSTISEALAKPKIQFLSLGYIVLFLLFLSACAPSSTSDLRVMGEAETLRLAKLLHKVDTKDDLQRNLPKVKKSYLKIAELVLQVREFHDAIDIEPSDESDQLFSELARLYEMPGCRELMESAQNEALALLKR